MGARPWYRRRMANLGYSDSEHRRKGDHSAFDIKTFLRDTESALAKGSCERAFTGIARAAQTFGELNVHTHASGVFGTRENKLHNEYHKVREAFTSACLRPAPGLGRSRRRRR